MTSPSEMAEGTPTAIQTGGREWVYKFPMLMNGTHGPIMSDQLELNRYIGIL
jgi:hypothetical protein